MLCRSCDKDVHPFQQFTLERGIVSKCPSCNGGLEAPVSEAVTSGNGGAVHKVEPPLAIVRPIAPVSVPVAPPAAPQNDILAAARTRLETVREAIVSLRQYEAEEAMLERMIAAAEPPSAPRLAIAR